MTWDAARKRLDRATDSATVSYRRDDGLYATTVGYGVTQAARVTDADSQLPPGLWTRQAVSTPSTILADLVGRGDPWVLPQERLGSLLRYEGKTVTMRAASR